MDFRSEWFCLKVKTVGQGRRDIISWNQAASVKVVHFAGRVVVDVVTTRLVFIFVRMMSLLIRIWFGPLARSTSLKR